MYNILNKYNFLNNILSPDNDWQVNSDYKANRTLSNRKISYN